MKADNFYHVCYFHRVFSNVKHPQRELQTIKKKFAF
jgi:hypothetical protein